MHIINTLTPVFAIIALGAALRKTNLLSRELLKGMAWLAYWVGLPVLLFYKTAMATLGGRSAGWIFLALSIAGGLCFLVGLVLVKVMRIRADSVGPFLQSIFRGNLAYVGLPVIVYAAMGIEGLDPQTAETVTLLVLAPMIIVYNGIAVVVLLAGRQRDGSNGLKMIAYSMATNPLIIACVLGCLFCLARVSLPTALLRTCEGIGQMSLPLMLMTIGGRLAEGNLKGNRRIVALAVFLKVVFLPAVGFLVAFLLGLNRMETLITLVNLACPTAVASFVLVQQLGGDEELAAGVVFLSSLASMVSLTVVVALV